MLYVQQSIEQVEYRLSELFPEYEGKRQALASQVPFIEDEDHRGADYVGGFGSGKTTAGCIKAIKTALKYPKSFGLILRKTVPELRTTTRKEFFELCPQEIIRKWRETTSTLTLHNGSVIWFASFDDIDKIRSLNLSWFYMDEGSEFDEETFLMLRYRLRNKTGPRTFWITSNPAGHDWMWKYFHPDSPDREKNYLLVQANSLDNPSLPEDYTEDLLKMPKPMRKRYVEGSMDFAEGLIFYEFSEAIHIIPPLASLGGKGLDLPKLFPNMRILDHGLSKATCCLFAFIDFDGNLVFYDEHYEAGQPVSYHASKIKEKMGHQVFSYIPADPSIFSLTQQDEKRGVYTVADDYLENGLDWTPADHTWNSGVNRVLELLRPQEGRLSPYKPSLQKSPRIYICANCVNLLKELRNYQWQKVRLKFSTFKEKPKADCEDHACDCLRYGCMELPKAPKRYVKRVDDILMDNFKNRKSFYYRKAVAQAMRKDEYQEDYV